jgi:hypothetical protein
MGGMDGVELDPQVIHSLGGCYTRSGQVEAITAAAVGVAQ